VSSFNKPKKSPEKKKYLGMGYQARNEQGYEGKPLLMDPFAVIFYYDILIVR
jgi:hypothetical protein